MSQFGELKQACKQFETSLEQLQVGAVTQNKKVSAEKDILHLKETSEIIKSKIKTIKVSTPPVEHRDYANVDLQQEKAELMNDVINSQQADIALHNILIGNFLESIQKNTSKESAIETYRKRIFDQLELIRNNSVQIKQVFERYEEVSGDICKNLIEKHNTFSNNLKERTIQYNAECDKSYSETYKQKMELINSRIEKINFMRNLVCRLIIADSNINLKQNPELKEIFKTENILVSLDSLLKE